MFISSDVKHGKANRIADAKIEKLRAESDQTRANIEKAARDLEHLEHKAARLIQSHSVQERKARTRRLIERGAIAESFVPGAETLTNDEFKAVLNRAFHATN